MIENLDAGKMSEYATAEYGREVNFALMMEGQHYERVSVAPLSPDEKVLLNNFIQNGELPDIEVLLAGLCSRGYVPEGEYLLHFDD